MEQAIRNSERRVTTVTARVVSGVVALGCTGVFFGIMALAFVGG